MNFICNYTEEDIQKIARDEFIHHPKSLLRDYYKLFFQSYWGQGHFVSDVLSVKMFLKQEVSQMLQPYNPIIQDISNSKCLYRISLSAVKEQLISAPDFLHAFIDYIHKGIDWVMWQKKWERIKLLLGKWYPELSDTDENNFIDKSIEQHIIISHSECFRLTYNPHYRVMQLNSLNSFLINRLKEYK